MTDLAQNLMQMFKATIWFIFFSFLCAVKMQRGLMWLSSGDFGLAVIQVLAASTHWNEMFLASSLK